MFLCPFLPAHLAGRSRPRRSDLPRLQAGGPYGLGAHKMLGSAAAVGAHEKVCSVPTAIDALPNFPVGPVARLARDIAPLKLMLCHSVSPLKK